MVIVIGHLIELLVVTISGQISEIRTPRFARRVVGRRGDTPLPYVARGPVPKPLTTRYTRVPLFIDCLVAGSP